MKIGMLIAAPLREAPERDAPSVEATRYVRFKIGQIRCALASIAIAAFGRHATRHRAA